MSNLSTSLREGTQQSHTAAENTAFMKCLMKGIVEREPLRKLFADLYFVYDALETALRHNLDHPSVGAIYFSELNRAESLADDLAFYYAHILHQYISTDFHQSQNMRKRACNNIDENSEYHSPVRPINTLHVDRADAQSLSET